LLKVSFVTFESVTLTWIIFRCASSRTHGRIWARFHLGVRRIEHRLDRLITPRFGLCRAHGRNRRDPDTRAAILTPRKPGPALAGYAADFYYFRPGCLDEQFLILFSF
jgi:hypothetical protein